MKALEMDRVNTPEPLPCPSCGTPVQALVFPAMFRELPTGTAGEKLLVADEAGCFFHPKKKAVVPCDACGRFLCALCDVDFNGRHLCPLCLESGQKKRKIKNLEKHRTIYDSIVLYMAVLPMFTVWLTLITAPLTIVMAIRYWKAPSSILPRTKIRFIAAMGIAALQVAGWTMFFYQVTK